jgi:signal transduction histidine kinase
MTTMKSIPWRFWFVFTFCVGFGPGLGVGFGIAGATRSPLIGFIVGTLSIAIFAALGAWWYRGVMRKRDPSFTMRDADAFVETNIELPIDAGDAYALCVGALKQMVGFYATKQDASALVIEGVTGGGAAGYWSFGAAGERLAVHVTDVGAKQSRVFMKSRPGTIFQVLDFGRNRDNLARMSQTINRQLQLRYAEAEQAAERAEMQRSIAAAKLNALQSQIEPHFLYNTLANAQSLTRSDPARADEMLGHLIIYLRSSLAQHRDGESTVAEEFERTRAFLEIMKIRMGSRLDFSIAYDPSLSQQPMPPLMLQTLVENAIKHGLEPKSGGGSLHVSATRAVDAWRVSVRDNGVGLTGSTGGTGIGLKNIRERLQILYAGAASLQLQSSSDGGVTASIQFPLQKTSHSH